MVGQRLTQVFGGALSMIVAVACAKGPEAEVQPQIEPPVESVVETPLPAPEPAPSDGPAAEGELRRSATQALGLEAPVSPVRLVFTPRSLGPLDRESQANVAGLMAEFPECEVVAGSYDHLGRPAPYFEIVCDGVAILGVLGSPGKGGDGGKVVGVRVLARELTPPSGFGVGVRYAPLAELNPDLECRPAVLPGAGDLFPEDSTICAGGLAPNILYVFRGRTFSRDSPGPDRELLRIDELHWLPQAAP